MKRLIGAILVLAASIVNVATLNLSWAGTNRSAGASENQTVVTVWNGFANALYVLHQRGLQGREVRTEQSIGGYGGEFLGDSEFYVETHYFDRDTGQSLGWIQREKADPDKIHAITVNVYDQQGRLTIDYMAAFLPVYRNAPIQTTVNLHAYPGKLHAYRQFDASDIRTYEHCTGQFRGEEVDLSLYIEDLPDWVNGEPVSSPHPAYETCFSEFSESAASEINDVLVDAGLLKVAALFVSAGGNSADEIEARIEKLGKLIERSPKDGELYIKRGDAYFQLLEFDMAVFEYSNALEIDDKLDEAWYGRGMANGRAGDIDAGIADLNIYIKRNPNSSLAYTKRGVRYVWKGDLDSARKDLERAVELDPTNAEAHDDLGVVYAQQGRHLEALKHFSETIRFDPRYQKGYHNMAMVYYLLEDNQQALKVVDQGLAINPSARDSLMLKASVLTSLGQTKEAARTKERAQFLPESNWSERLAVQ